MIIISDFYYILYYYGYLSRYNIFGYYDYFSIYNWLSCNWLNAIKLLKYTKLIIIKLNNYK